MRFNASTTLKKKTQNGGSLYKLALVKKKQTELIEDSDAENTKRQRKYAVAIFELTFIYDGKSALKTSLRFTAPGESFAVEFVVIKHFGCESLNVQPSCCLDVVDVVVYMLNFHVLETYFARN